MKGPGAWETQAKYSVGYTQNADTWPLTQDSSWCLRPGVSSKSTERGQSSRCLQPGGRETFKHPKNDGDIDQHPACPGVGNQPQVLTTDKRGQALLESMVSMAGGGDGVKRGDGSSGGGGCPSNEGNGWLVMIFVVTW